LHIPIQVFPRRGERAGVGPVAAARAGDRPSSSVNGKPGGGRGGTRKKEGSNITPHHTRFFNLKKRHLRGANYQK